MTADLLIFKKKGEKGEVKITKRMRNGYSADTAMVEVNIANYRDVALFLHDLEDLYGVNMLKAVTLYLSEKENNWPF